MTEPADRRKDPAQILREIQRTDKPGHRGRLKVFLGFAAGVGKTCEMLSEANRRKQRGQDVVIGYVETHGRAGTVEQLGNLETVPRRAVEYKGATFEEMDTDAVIKRRPQWALVDELAHTNVPGSETARRWQDVELLLDAGISVLTTLNVQHMESLNDIVFDLTGVRVRETVPDHVVKHADEVIMVDITPRALVHRLERGDIYAREKVAQARSNWFQEANLTALREIALREIAGEVDTELEGYRSDTRRRKPLVTHDRIMVCVGPGAEGMRLLRRGWRIATRLHADIVAVYVEAGNLTEQQEQQFKNALTVADRLGIAVVTLHGEPSREIVRYAREHTITQVVVGHTSRNKWQELVRGSIIRSLTHDLKSVDILIVAAEEEN